MPLYDSTYICCCGSESRSGAAPGEKDRGSAESCDKAPSESCRGSVLRRDRAATWQEEAKRDHFLTLSLIPSHPSLHPPGHPRHGLVIARCTDGECVCVCVNVCISAWIRAPVCGAETCFGRFSCPETYSQLLRRFWEQSERKRRDETGSSPRIDFSPLLDSP